jgi:prepilin-type N-terminal cleavage/methylation domain-containing protein
MLFTTKKNNKGFTLIEMLIAVFIFSVALAALMSISARGLKAARLAQNQVTADYLAIEGIEIVRNLRDSAFLLGSSTNTWSSVFNQNGCLGALRYDTNDRCTFELIGQQVILYPCSSGSCILFYNETSGIYRHFQSGSATPNFSIIEYERRINLKEATGNADEIIVTVDVSWDTGSVQYVENLFLWR